MTELTFCHSAAPSSSSSRRFNREGEGAAVTELSRTARPVLVVRGANAAVLRRCTAVQSQVIPPPCQSDAVLK